jgi:hypothetical protein
MTGRQSSASPSRPCSSTSGAAGSETTDSGSQCLEILGDFTARYLDFNQGYPVFRAAA